MSSVPAHDKKPLSFRLTLILLIFSELFFLFVALSIGSMVVKGTLITIGVVLILVNARRLTTH